MEAWERDLDWLRDHFGYADENEQDAFCEKVACLVYEGMAEITAREQALGMIRDQRKERHQ